MTDTDEGFETKAFYYKNLFFGSLVEVLDKKTQKIKVAVENISSRFAEDSNHK